MLMNHSMKRDVGYIEYDVTVETAQKLTPVKAYWLDVTNCRGHVYYNVPGGDAPGSTELDHGALAAAVQRQARGRRRPPARRHEGHEHVPAALRGQADRGVEAAVRIAGRPRLPRASGAARARPDQHELVQDGDGHPGREGRADQGVGRLRRRAAAREGDGGDARVHGAGRQRLAGLRPAPRRPDEREHQRARPHRGAGHHGSADRDRADRQGADDRRAARQGQGAERGYERPRARLLVQPAEPLDPAGREHHLAVPGHDLARRDARERPVRLLVAVLAHREEVHAAVRAARARTSCSARSTRS